MKHYRRHSDPFLCTLIQRTDVDGDQIDVDMVIHFRVTSHVPGYKGDHIDPPCGDEYEFEIDRIEFDSGRVNPNQPPDDAPWLLTDEEDAALRQWFDANYDQAYQAAVDAAPDYEAERADYEYERRRDEEMDERRELRRAAE